MLVIEDETVLAEGLRFNLEAEGYRVTVCRTGEEGLREFAASHFDLVILDIMLPGIDGFDTARRMRALDPVAPIFMLTARVSHQDRIRGLECGAEDYLPKPFNLRELLLRVAALLRRSRLYNQAVEEFTTVGDNTIDFNAGTITRGSATFQLTVHEMSLLQYLIRNRDRVVTREELLANVWGYSMMTETRTVDAFISRLRKKLEPRPARPRHLLSIRGRGYQLMSGEAAPDRPAQKEPPP
ncbi:response regulator transcription factor [bacterium]|nr:response regulator transcription factor [candidate division CSSED10-310 bacterium]